MKICIDAGHGGKSSGAVGIFSEEKDINLQLALILQEKLRRSKIDTVMTRSDDVYLDLQQRCDVANKNKCDYFISIHCNGFSDSSASGTETFYYTGKEGLGLASEIQKAVIGYNKNKDRGVKTADFYVLKYTDMPAVLLECAFITNKKEEEMLNSKDWQEGFIKAVTVAVCSFVGVQPDVEEISYKVLRDNEQVGVFTVKNNAVSLAEEILAEISSGNVRVVSSKDEIIFDKTKLPEVPDSPGTDIPSDITLHSISDIRRASAEQMESFVHRINPGAPYLAKLYLSIGAIESIRGDVAFSQAVKETNYFRFTGNVKPEQNNFCGLGSTGPGIPGASFTTVEEGVTAHIQHLKAYANTDPLKTQLVDSRFNLVKRGSAPNWEELNGKWAVPGNDYGQSVINIWRRILDEQVPEGYIIPEKPGTGEPYKVIDKKLLDEIDGFAKILIDLAVRLKSIFK